MRKSKDLSKILIRPFSMEKDFKSYMSWFKGHGWVNPPVKELLSDVGLMAVDGYGERLAAVFIYYTNSKIVLMEWLVTNPKIPAVKAIKALDTLVNHIKVFMIKNKNLRFLMGVTDHPKLRRHYQTKHQALTDQQCWVIMWDKDRGRYNGT